MAKKLCHRLRMFIRQTKTNTTSSGKVCFTFRLVASKRIGGKVRQQTLLNLGRNFSVPKEQWPELCRRIEQILSAQTHLFPISTPNESLAQRYAAQLVENGWPRASSPEQMPQTPEITEIKQATVVNKPEYTKVDINSLEMLRPRSVGVEHVGLAALRWLELPRIFEDLGFNGVQQAAATAAIIGRLAKPGSEQATWAWLTQRSGLGELLGVDFETQSVMALHRVSDLLVKNRQVIEKRMFSRITTLFNLPETVTLFDLTNTFFEGEMSKNIKAKRGHSKEKRSDCPLVTLALVLDGSGFVQRSRMFAGNAAEAATLQEMLDGLSAQKGALVVMDRGIATKENVQWLRDNSYKYIVANRERSRLFDPDKAVEIKTASGGLVQMQRVVNEAEDEVRMYCFSEDRAAKEESITKRFCDKFENGLRKIAESLRKPHGQKNKEKILQRIGRLQEQSHGVSQYYQLTFSTDATGAQLAEITWEKDEIVGSRLANPGVYCLRSNEMNWDEATLWRTYTMLTDLEAVFRSLKSELGLRPVYHHKQDRSDGHLFITVLAYQLVQVIRKKLKNKEIHSSWQTLREIFASQQRITATFCQEDGHSLHIRKATIAEPNVRILYEALGLSTSPGGMRKLIY